MSLIKTMTSVLKASTDISTHIPAHPIRLAAILAGKKRNRNSSHFIPQFFGPYCSS